MQLGPCLFALYNSLGHLTHCLGCERHLCDNNSHICLQSIALKVINHLLLLILWTFFGWSFTYKTTHTVPSLSTGSSLGICHIMLSWLFSNLFD